MTFWISRPFLCSAVEAASPLLVPRVTSPSSLVEVAAPGGHLVAAPAALLLLLLVGPGVPLPHLVHVAAAEHLGGNSMETIDLA